jgi:murein L,D-transpeptidase YcbB/YkuD
MRRAAAPPPAERRIEVNVPHQRLQVMDGERQVLDMAVIVGRPDRATPMMRVRMNAVQFNPPWGVPERNAREDLLPRFRRDARAMMEKGFRVYGMVDGQRVEIDPTTIDWTSVSANRFPYFIRQNAGDNNALGRIKFIMPNGEDIFMHDTPDRHLFRRPDRAFSSGCIRLERPMELLDIVMEGMPGWDRGRVARVLDSRQTSSASLARSFPVRLHYTSVIVQGGEVRMRSDIYGLDEAYARALDGGTPTRARVVASGGTR